MRCFGRFGVCQRKAPRGRMAWFSNCNGAFSSRFAGGNGSDGTCECGVCRQHRGAAGLGAAPVLEAGAVLVAGCCSRLHLGTKPGAPRLRRSCSLRFCTCCAKITNSIIGAADLFLSDILRLISYLSDTAKSEMTCLIKCFYIGYTKVSNLAMETASDTNRLMFHNIYCPASLLNELVCIRAKSRCPLPSLTKCESTFFSLPPKPQFILTHFNLFLNSLSPEK